MKTRVTAEMKKLIRQELARAGGEARAKKYSKAKLSEWAKLGGRPKKQSAKKRGSEYANERVQESPRSV